MNVFWRTSSSSSAMTSASASASSRTTSKFHTISPRTQAQFLFLHNHPPPRNTNHTNAYYYSLPYCCCWIFFLMGCLLGHFHGRYHSFPSPWDTILTTSIIKTGDSFSENNMEIQSQLTSTMSENGWKSIHVFYGTNEYEQKQNETTTTISLVRTRRQEEEQQQQTTTWYSQAHQDELIIGLLKNKTNGFFVDLAANDAIQLSNTFALEQRYGWNGICIEPNPIYWYNLSQYRTCTIVGAVVGNRHQRMESVYFRFQAGDHGGIAGAGFDNGPRWQASSERRYTVPLVEILQQFASTHNHNDKNGPPLTMDYLSLDVEGAETYILQDFPFDQYTFSIITAERLRGEIRTYLKQNGYEFVKRLTRWGESLWVHKSVWEELDWTVLDRWDFPLF